MRTKVQSQTGVDVGDRVKTILGLKDLTLHQVSRRSAQLYGSSSPYLLSHGLYQELRSGVFAPSLHQLCALSRISGFMLLDWLHVFGFNLDGVLRMQASQPSKRTVRLDTSLDNSPNALVPWFQDAPGSSPSAGMLPLGQLVKPSQPIKLSSLSRTTMPGFLYAKVGHQDALAFPDLLPGSIVRVNSNIAELSSRTTERIFLVEHCKGLWCCRLHWTGEKRIVPLSRHLPYAHIELQIPGEARILGVVDLEIRRLCNVEQPEVPKDLAIRWTPERREQSHGGLGELLRQARGRMALSFREASALSRKIADTLGDERYFAAPGSLSDYEARDIPPRHIHKVFTLCLLYGVQFSAFLNVAGINLDELGKDTIPAGLMASPERSSPEDTIRTAENHADNPIVDSLTAQFGNLPLFLRGSLQELSGMSQLSLRDFFWAGAENNILYPYLEGGLLVVANRRKKKAFHSRSMPLWQQSVYVLNTRDEGYTCACCGIENGILVVHPYSTDFRRSEQFRNREDAEVIGQVVAVVRRLS